MKIERFGPVEPGRLYRVETEPRNVAGRQVPAAGADEISLSAEARLRQELLARLREIPAVREELVTALARKLAEGSYSVDVERLAAAIVEELRGQRG